MPERRWPLVVVLAVAAALAVWLLVARSEDDDSAPVGGRPQIVSAEQLSEFAAARQEPVYWLGERDDAEIELTETSSRRLYIRYLDDGAEVGDLSPSFLTVGTYPAADAAAALRRVARERDRVELARTDDGAVLLVDPASANNAHLAYPGADLEVEVYSPVPGQALRLASRGAVKPVP